MTTSAAELLVDFIDDLTPTVCPVDQTEMMAGQLVCMSCWVKIPEVLRRDVLTAYRSLKLSIGDPDKHAEWQRARDAALATLNG
jgi:hypothetical protein